MITRISKLKNFGIFHNFIWKKTKPPNFKKFNLIYGWNRSGKTTFSRVFSSCEKNCTYDKDRFNQYPEEGEFEIETDDGTTVKSADVGTCILPIRVFNRDFIYDNISFDPSNSCNPIVYVSEEDIESKKRLKDLKSERKGLDEKLEKIRKKRELEEGKVDAICQEIGGEVRGSLSISNITYHKKTVKEKINSIGIDNFDNKVLSEKDKENYETIIKDGEKESQKLLSKLEFPTFFVDQGINNFQELFKKVGILLDKEIVAKTLDRLKKDPTLNRWVKQGFDMYKNKKKEEKEKCYFCEKPLDSNFLDVLAAHFSRDYEELQEAITQFSEELKKIREVLKRKNNIMKEKTIEIKNNALYSDLKNKYLEEANRLIDCIEKMGVWINDIEKVLQKKYERPLEVIKNTTAPDDLLTSYNNSVSELNEVIAKHNMIVENHSDKVSRAKEILELHLIATGIIRGDYKKIVTELKELKREEEDIEGKQKDNKFDDIAKLEKQTSNIGEAINDINKWLKEFFGGEEIELVLSEDKKGYVIKRGIHPAKTLSESEKTAIAFSYFVVKINERGFDKSKGIVFIDDPISSFDSNFVYHCFSMIKAHFGEVGQLFISTHNFQLFNLIKEWFRVKKESASSCCQEGKSAPCQFFMVENFDGVGTREAQIVALDKTLCKYKSEYHFLFAKLNEFLENSDMQYEDFYTIGNTARRFFDIFVDFKIPITDNQRAKIDRLMKNINNSGEKISRSKSGKVYKLINEFSHNFDPTSTIEHKDKSETKRAIEDLLKIVKVSDPLHYECLERAVK